jgi:hypothetical protein
MSRIEKFAKSPKAKQLEREMIRKAKDPYTKEKISKGFESSRRSTDSSCVVVA